MEPTVLICDQTDRKKTYSYEIGRFALGLLYLLASSTRKRSSTAAAKEQAQAEGG
jgi:hypothetical protein